MVSTHKVTVQAARRNNRWLICAIRRAHQLVNPDVDLADRLGNTAARFVALLRLLVAADSSFQLNRRRQAACISPIVDFRKPASSALFK